MPKIPVPIAVIAAAGAVALAVSGLHGALEPDHDSLLLEPSDRDEAVRLGTLEESAETPARPVLPPVPTLPSGTKLARTHGAGAGPSEAGDDLSAEMRLLSEARRTMPEDPMGALALLDQHRERYPQGALREEREAYSILILRRLDRVEEGERRYIDFSARFPDSSFLPVLTGRGEHAEEE